MYLPNDMISSSFTLPFRLQYVQVAAKDLKVGATTTERGWGWCACQRLGVVAHQFH
jgi:hypothetical protein